LRRAQRAGRELFELVTWPLKGAPFSEARKSGLRDFRGFQDAAERPCLALLSMKSLWMAELGHHGALASEFIQPMFRQ
jgi:hypothetical protein